MSLYDFRLTTRKIQNALSGYSNLENLIRESTNTDAWGPTTVQKKQLLNWILTYTEPSSSTDYYDTDEAYPSNDDIHVNQSSYDSEVGSFAINFIFERLDEYSSHRPKSLYANLKKNLVTKGYEFVIITKCLNLLEFLLLNCFTEKGGIIEYDVNGDIKAHKQTLSRLKNYKVKVAYDNLNLNHEKQINHESEKLLELINDPDLLKTERTKFHPSLSQKKNRTTVAAKTPSSLFYEQSTLGTFKSGAFHKSKDPFARSSVSSISNQIGSLITSPSKSKKKSNSISLSNEDNDIINLTKTNRGSNYNFNHVKYGHQKNDERSEFIDWMDNDEDEPYRLEPYRTISKKSLGLKKDHSNVSNDDDDDDDDDEFGGFQTGQVISESHPEINTSSDTGKEILNLFSINSTSPVSPIMPKLGTSHPPNNYLAYSTLQPISDDTKVKQNSFFNDSPKNSNKINQNEDVFNSLLLDFKTAKPK